MGLITNAQIEHALRQEAPWQQAYNYVEARAKEYLEFIDEGSSVSTNELEKALYSGQGSYDPAVQKRIFNALKALAKHGLRYYVSDAEPSKVAGKMVIRKRWHRPMVPAKNVCPTCHQEIKP